mmetsp:Transcript_16906/g.20659  ORF Transcript_16906/g.20659 Transcript_16906/m.20659 type:complete len:616 (-) Transcript_16906:717-2564(-)
MSPNSLATLPLQARPNTSKMTPNANGATREANSGAAPIPYLPHYSNSTRGPSLILRAHGTSNPMPCQFSVDTPGFLPDETRQRKSYAAASQLSVDTPGFFPEETRKLKSYVAMSKAAYLQASLWTKETPSPTRASYSPKRRRRTRRKKNATLKQVPPPSIATFKQTPTIATFKQAPPSMNDCCVNNDSEELFATIKQQYVDIDELFASLKAQNAKISTVQSDLNTVRQNFTREVSSLRSENSSLKNELASSLSSFQLNLRTIRENLTKEVSSIKLDIRAIRQNVTKDISSFKSDFKNITKEVSSLRSEVRQNANCNNGRSSNRHSNKGSSSNRHINNSSSSNFGSSNREKFKIEKGTFILEEDEGHVDVNHDIHHVISGIRIRGNMQSSSPSQVRVIGGLPIGGFSEEISVIEDVPTDIEIDEDNNSFAESKNSDDVDEETWIENNANFEQDYREHDNRQDAHDNYQNESVTNFSSVCDQSQGQSFIYDSINRPQDPCGFQYNQTVCREEESIYDSITRPYDPCNLHNLETVYQEESDHEDYHEDDTLHSMCGSNMSSERMSCQNDNSVQVDCCVSRHSVRSGDVYSDTSDSSSDSCDEQQHSMGYYSSESSEEE